MRRDDAIRIRHMIEAAEACERFVPGRGRTELETNLMLGFALCSRCRNLWRSSLKGES
jgi:hypothetical protein